MTSQNKKFLTTILIVAAIIAVAVGLIKWGSQIENKPKGGDELVLSGSHRTGPSGTAVTIVEFGDLQCPACRAAEPIIKQLLLDHPNDVSLVFRHFPLPSHQNTIAASLAAEAAAEQGKFWEMKDRLYTEQPTWEMAANPADIFAGYARDLGLDTARFDAAVKNDELLEKIMQDKNDALKLGVNATPTFFINGQRFVGIPDQKFTDLINAELQK